MKQCKKINQLMADAVYGDLSETGKRVFQDHIDTCPQCAQDYDKIKKTLGVMEQRERPEMSTGFWDNYYQRLEEKLDHSEKLESKERRKQLSVAQPHDFTVSTVHEPPSKRRWLTYVLATAAVLFVAAGIALYMSSMYEEDEGFAAATAAIPSYNTAVSDHFDSVQPVLVDYANYTPSQNKPVYAAQNGGEDELVTIGKSAIKKLLLENQMLKRVVAKQKNIPAKQLLEELEVILLELENGGDDPRGTRQLIKELIDEYDILFKMDVYKKKRKQKTLSPTTSL